MADARRGSAAAGLGQSGLTAHGPPAGVRARGRSMLRLRRLIVPALLLLTWQAVAQSGMFKPIFMPPLQAIGARIVDLVRTDVLLPAAMISMGRLAAGFSIAVVLGLALGLLITRLGFAERLAVRLLSALLATPAVAWTPLFMLWFGLGNPATIALIVFVGTVPIALNTWSGLSEVDRIYVRVAQSMNVHGLERFRKVMVPAAFAPILAGIRLGFARSWHGLVAGELLAGAASGLGVLVTKGLVFLDTPSMITGVLTIATLAYVTERLVFERLEQQMLTRRGLRQA